MFRFIVYRCWGIDVCDFVSYSQHSLTVSGLIIIQVRSSEMCLKVGDSTLRHIFVRHSVAQRMTGDFES